ncbi:hypothetical protein VWM73_11890, partial [Campylobacter coli]
MCLLLNLNFAYFHPISRWNDYPRMANLVELDKQAHKFIIAYFIAKMEKDVDMKII